MLSVALTVAFAAPAELPAAWALEMAEGIAAEAMRLKAQGVDIVDLGAGIAEIGHDAIALRIGDVPAMRAQDAGRRLEGPPRGPRRARECIQKQHVAEAMVEGEADLIEVSGIVHPLML